MKYAAVIGHPIGQSLSPIIHQYWCNMFDIDGDYHRFDIEPQNLNMFFTEFKAGHYNDTLYNGVNVTIPHKCDVMEYCDSISHLAQHIGAVNMITRRVNDDKTISLHGDNSDHIGIHDHLKQYGVEQCDVEQYAFKQQHKTAILLGAGGASRAIIIALEKLGFTKIIIANRTYDKALALCAIAPDLCHAIEWNDAAITPYASTCDLVVNSSSLGMKMTDFQLDFPFPFAALPKHCFLYDAIYNPFTTWFMASGHAHDLRNSNGLGMLIHQAVPGFQQWLGDASITPIIDDALYQHVMTALASS